MDGIRVKLDIFIAIREFNIVSSYLFLSDQMVCSVSLRKLFQSEESAIH